MDNAKSAKRLITIKVNSELEARIAAAAEQHQMSIDQYLEDLLGQAVPAQTSIKRVRRHITPEGVKRLIQVRDRILQEHGGQPFENSVELLRQERKEREDVSLFSCDRKSQRKL